MICSTWPTVDCCDIEPSADELLAASEILYALSGRQFPGLCAETVRPCAAGSPPTRLSHTLGSNWFVTRWGDTLLNVRCGCHMDYSCACGGVPQVDLGRYDVTAINKVDIDGVTLSASNYRLDEGRYLVRTDGEQWPCCQDLSKDIGETGTWYIELDYGREPPTSGRLAVSKLACELQKACNNADDCTLPSYVQNVVRQGVSFVIPTAILKDGQTGLFEVDAFLQAVNPQGIARRASAWSYGMKGRARRVGVLGS